MEARNFATRMSSFAIISSIEADLRNVIYISCSEKDSESVLPRDVYENASRRYSSDNGGEASEAKELSYLLDYVDFQDLSKILHRVKSDQSTFNSEEIEFISDGLIDLTACRNRVCHSRPLEAEDYPSLLDFAYEIRKFGGSRVWINVNEAIRNKDNPVHALSLEIPSFWRDATSTVYNNLSIPEFDDTGFLGRKKDRESINTLIGSNVKVISIIGEGGIGKTALAERCLYDALDECEKLSIESRPFDIIAWVTLKANKLTVSGVEQIRGAIGTQSGLLKGVSSALSGYSSSEDSLSDVLDEINEYMSEFKVLLCIDNLETISNDEVRDFLANIPNGSKVLITTRVGLGEIEYRYKLDKLDDKSSAHLIRNLAKLINHEPLVKKKQLALEGIAKQLFNNPLLIKWYVLSVAAGKDPSGLLNKAGDSFQTALRFCFENLYDRLDSTENRIISIIAAYRKPISTVQLRFFLDDLDELKITEAIHTLQNSSMLKSMPLHENSVSLFVLTDVAEEYLNVCRPVSRQVYEFVKSKKRELQVQIEDDAARRGHHEYDVNAVHWESRDEQICSIFIKKALLSCKRGDFKKAECSINKAKGIMHDFSEIYRANGFILSKEYPHKAEREFEKALEYNPKSTIALYAFALFLRDEEEFDRSLELINRAISLDGDQMPLLTFKAFLLMVLGSYSKAVEIYEMILPQQKDRLRKFRISTYDQAAECYKRMAIQAVNDKDFGLAENCLTRASAIIKNSFELGDMDHGLVNRLLVILKEADRFFFATRKFGPCDNIFSICSSLVGRVDAKTSTALRCGVISLERVVAPECKEAIKLIVSRLDDVTQVESGREYGTIRNVERNAAKYGFILSSDNESFFFLPSEFRHNEPLSADHVGLNVNFVATPGDERGRVAQDVQVQDAQIQN